MKINATAVGVLTACCVLAGAARADVEVAGVFGDHMVLQRDEKVAIWGTADAGEEVSVTFAEQTEKTRAADDGKWSVTLGPFDAAAGLSLAIVGKNTLTLQDVCVGEVWICSGQSNMQWPLRQTDGADEAIAAASDTELRLFTVPRRVMGEPADDVKGKWVLAAPESVPGFSAVAYHFGKQLRARLGVPVGLIHSSWGGTPAEAWTPLSALDDSAQKEPVLAPILTRWEQALANWPNAKKAYDARVAKWKTAAEAARVAGKKPPRRPGPPRGPQHPHRAAGLWNGMIAPIARFGARGVIWYQGESNASRAEQYRVLFARMIEAWREGFERPDLRFYFVQLANFHAVKPEPAESTWAELRDAQRAALELPHTAMAVAIDIGAANNIHPRNKAEVGRRLALAALAQDYAADLADAVPEFSGPRLVGHRVKGSSIVLEFSHADGLRRRDGEELIGFAIAGKDRKFRWAAARVDGDTVVCSHPEIRKPVAVRYAWADNPECNLENAAGLPASPFRTDDWPGVTSGKR